MGNFTWEISVFKSIEVLCISASVVAILGLLLWKGAEIIAQNSRQKHQIEMEKLRLQDKETAKQNAELKDKLKEVEHKLQIGEQIQSLLAQIAQNLKTLIDKK